MDFDKDAMDEDMLDDPNSNWNHMDPARRKRRTAGEQRRRNHVAATIKELGSALASVGVAQKRLQTQADVLAEAVLLIKGLASHGNSLLPPAVDHPRANQASLPPTQVLRPINKHISYHFSARCSSSF